MDAIVRSVFIYGVLLLLMRITGKRTMAEITTFDFILLLIISEATQQALIGDDFSVTTAALVIMTLIGIDLALQLLKERFRGLEKWIDGKPLVIVENGKLLRDRMTKERIDTSDILEAGRRLQGLESLDQIKYAILEKSGGITVIPKKSAR